MTEITKGAKKKKKIKRFQKHLKTSNISFIFWFFVPNKLTTLKFLNSKLAHKDFQKLKELVSFETTLIYVCFLGDRQKSAYSDVAFKRFPSSFFKKPAHIISQG